MLFEAKRWITWIMRKSSLLGISLLFAVSVTACGGETQEEITEQNQTVVASEAESDVSSQESASSFSNEQTEDEVVVDKENLPEEMEEGEAAMIAYNSSDETIAGSLPDIEINLDQLREKNPDVCAYIVAPGTSIESPVLKKNDSNEYYLEHNAEDEDDPNGCIFMDMGNETDFTDPVTCLYARSGDKEPFGDLVSFLDSDYMNKNEYIYIYSDEFAIQYKVFAAYSTDETERLLVRYNFYDYAEYQQYIDEILSIRDMTAVINRDLRDSAMESWNIITLIGVNDDGSRQIVQAVFNGRAVIN